jgi:hypothetical protein
MIPFLLKEKLELKYGKDFILPKHIDLLRPFKEAFQGDEHDLQKAFFANNATQQLGDPFLYLMHAIPNGGTRNKIEAGRLKAEGVKAGIPDCFWPVARQEKIPGNFRFWHGLYIEFKTKRNTPSEDQRIMMLMLDEQGYKVVCVNTLDDAIKVFSDYYILR